ncbi:hypothetical protein ACIRRA_30705 [Nocardia sp. NPDC101769]|uniref:hypothetical protein n=1 Tax=Nocardia sp. NPDC101769 TaxID=3364333 RepID=UPI00380070F8
MNARFHDPEGKRYGIPTYPWKTAPTHLRTESQLAQDKRRPGGEAQAQVLGTSRRFGRLQAYLYDPAEAVPKLKSSDAQLESLRIARWVRSANACEDRGIDATDMRELIAQARADLAARRQTRRRGERDRRRSR